MKTKLSLGAEIIASAPGQYPLCAPGPTRYGCGIRFHAGFNCFGTTCRRFSLKKIDKSRSAACHVFTFRVGVCSIEERAPMIRNRRSAELFLARTSAPDRGTRENRLPIQTAVALVTGANVALWLLIALALDDLLL